MKVAFQQPIAAASGRASSPGTSGGIVLWTSSGAGYARQFVIPGNPQTSKQTGMRALFSAVATAFKSLNAAEKTLWEERAGLITQTNPVGGEFNLQAMGYYQRVNIYRLMNAQAVDDAAPIPSTPATPDSINSATINGTDIEVSVTHQLEGTGAFLYVRLTKPLPSSTRNARQTDLRTITETFAESIIDVAASPQTIALPMDEFVLAANDFIGVEVTPISSDYVPGTSNFLKSIQVD